MEEKNLTSAVSAEENQAQETKKKFSLQKVEVKNPIITAAILVALAVACVVYLSFVFLQMRTDDVFYAGKGVTEVKKLSTWYPALAGTAADTDVYILKGEEEGDGMLVFGGVHANEPAGVLSATYLLENCTMKAGTLYVIPETNKLGFTCTDPQEASPMFYDIVGSNGEKRTFRYGSRATNPIYQWPDPDIYVRKAPDGQTLAGSETRNLNRVYPGVDGGTNTEKIAYGLIQLINKEDIKIAVDLHEASPEYQTINTIVYHQNADELVGNAVLWYLDGAMPISKDASPTSFHGLSHRELGDNTKVLATLMETCNAAQGRLHGKTSPELVVTGVDKFYVQAYENNRLPASVTYDETGHPMAERVARHVTACVSFAASFTDDLGLGNIRFGSFGDLDAELLFDYADLYNEIYDNLYDNLVDAKLAAGK